MENIKENILKEFDEKFSDLTHVSCLDKSIPCGTVKDDVANFISQSLDQALDAQADKLESERYWVPCAGCQDGHPSFWKTVIESKYWKEWAEYANKNLLYDIDSCEECGVISAQHFDEFMNYCLKIDKWKIWSIEHQGWWRPNHQGYTKEIKEAGRYSTNEAVSIVRSANIGDKNTPNEAMILS
jgi:hypothetical protein